MTDTEKRIEQGLAWLKDAIDEGYSYVRWDGSQPARECPICNGHSREGGYYGGNCIWFSSAYLYHGMGLEGIKCACDGLLGGNTSYMRLLVAPYARAQAFADSKLGSGRFRLIRKTGRGRLTTSDLEAGDIIIYYRSVLFWHVAVYIGNGRIIDCAGEPGGVSERSWRLPYPCRAALRYIGR